MAHEKIVLVKLLREFLYIHAYSYLAKNNLGIEFGNGGKKDGYERFDDVKSVFFYAVTYANMYGLRLEEIQVNRDDIDNDVLLEKSYTAILVLLFGLLDNSLPELDAALFEATSQSLKEISLDGNGVASRMRAQMALKFSSHVERFIEKVVRRVADYSCFLEIPAN